MSSLDAVIGVSAEMTVEEMRAALEDARAREQEALALARDAKAKEEEVHLQYVEAMRARGVALIRHEDGTYEHVTEENDAYAPKTVASAPLHYHAVPPPSSHPEHSPVKKSASAPFAVYSQHTVVQPSSLPAQSSGFQPQHSAFGDSQPQLDLNSSFQKSDGYQFQSTQSQSQGGLSKQHQSSYLYSGNQLCPEGFVQPSAGQLGYSPYQQGTQFQSRSGDGQDSQQYNGYDRFGNKVVRSVNMLDNGRGVPSFASLPPASLPVSLPFDSQLTRQYGDMVKPPQQQFGDHSGAPLFSSTAPPSLGQPSSMISEMAMMMEKIKVLTEQVEKMSVDNSGFKPIDPMMVQALPYKFKMPELDKFDGSGCPKTHVDTYAMTMRAKGCTLETMAAFFHMSLRDAALRWFITVPAESRSTWTQVTGVFLNKYKGNVEWITTRDDVMGTTQRANESITDFYKRWNAKLNELNESLPLRDQKDIFMSCIKPALRNAIGTGYYPDLREIVSVGARAENQIYNLPAAANTSGGYRYRAPNPAPTVPKDKEVANAGNSVNNIQGSQRPYNRQPDKFDDIGMSTEEAFNGLLQTGLIKPLENYGTHPNADRTKHCRFHQTHGHVTNECYTLKKIIQGLVDAGKIVKSPGPNTVDNPLPPNDNQA